MKQFIALLLFSALVLLPSASFAEDSGPVAAEPPIEKKEVQDPDLSDFLSDKKDSVYFTLSDLGDDEPHPYANMATEYAPSASEAHAMELCRQDPSDVNVLTLGILRSAIALQALETSRAKNPRVPPDEDPELRKALAYAQAAAELCPERPDFLYVLARVYGAFGANSATLSLAQETCEDALNLDPDHAETLLFMAGLELQDENFDDAVLHFLRAFTLKPELFDLNSMPVFGAACLISGRAAEGESFMLQRLNASPNDGTALFALAQFQRALGEKGEALETLKKATAALAQNASAAAYAEKTAALWQAEK